MNKKLEIARQDIDKVEALMYAIETTYLSLNVVPEDFEKLTRGTDAFYLLWDAIKKVSQDIEELENGSKIVEVAKAVRKSRSTEWTLTTKK